MKKRIVVERGIKVLLSIKSREFSDTNRIKSNQRSDSSVRICSWRNIRLNKGNKGKVSSDKIEEMRIDEILPVI